MCDSDHRRARAGTANYRFTATTGGGDFGASVGGLIKCRGAVVEDRRTLTKRMGTLTFVSKLLQEGLSVPARNVEVSADRRALLI